MKKKSEIRNPKPEINSTGFTLMELMVVIAIIVLLAGIMTPNVARRLERAKMTRAEADIAAIENAIAMYENDTGRYPESISTLYVGNSSIEILEWRLTGRRPTNGTTENSIVTDRNWHGPYIKGIEQDPWKQDYIYLKNEFPRNVGAQTPGQDYPLDGSGGCVTPPTNLSYYIYSEGKNKTTGTLVAEWDDLIDGEDNEDDINNWDVKKSWREEY